MDILFPWRKQPQSQTGSNNTNYHSLPHPQEHAQHYQQNYSTRSGLGQSMNGGVGQSVNYGASSRASGQPIATMGQSMRSIDEDDGVHDSFVEGDGRRQMMQRTKGGRSGRSLG